MKYWIDYAFFECDVYKTVCAGLTDNNNEQQNRRPSTSLLILLLSYWSPSSLPWCWPHSNYSLNGCLFDSNGGISVILCRLPRLAWCRPWSSWSLALLIQRLDQTIPEPLVSLNNYLLSAMMLLNVDPCIETLKSGECVSEKELKQLCQYVSELLMEESNVQPILSPVAMMGDLHGQLFVLMNLLKVGEWPPSTSNTLYIFLGDFVDWGHNWVETFRVCCCVWNSNILAMLPC